MCLRESKSSHLSSMLSLGLDFHQPHRGMSLGYPPERCGLSEWWSNLVYLNRKGKIKGEYSVENVYVAFFTMCLKQFLIETRTSLWISLVFPYFTLRLNQGTRTPLWTNQMQSLNNLVFLAIQAIFLFLEEGSWATCEIFPWLFWLSVTIHFVLQYGMWTRFVVILVKSCTAFI